MLHVYDGRANSEMSSENKTHAIASRVEQTRPALASAARALVAVEGKPVGGQLLLAFCADLQLLSGRVAAGRGPGPAGWQQQQRSASRRFL